MTLASKQKLESAVGATSFAVSIHESSSMQQHRFMRIAALHQHLLSRVAALQRYMARIAATTESEERYVNESE